MRSGNREVSPSVSVYTVGTRDPPPHPPAPGVITSDHPTSKVPLLSTVVLLVRVYRTGGNTWKGALPPPVHSGGPCYPGTFPRRPSPLAVKVQGKEVTSYIYAFTSDYATAQRGHQLHPVGLVQCLILVLKGLGLVPNTRLAWSLPPRRPSYLATSPLTCCIAVFILHHQLSAKASPACTCLRCTGAHLPGFHSFFCPQGLLMDVSLPACVVDDCLLCR